jgi:exodeoxyribonuclease V beta subunit
MIKLQTLDTVNIALSGTKLIEASAGTGKTYAITGLYVRLLIEQELDVDRILLLTFTEAATKELRERVRSRLLDALAVYELQPRKDKFLNDLYAKHCSEGRSVERCRQRVSLALHSIDLAAIHTIHGFCARVLQESAFESGLLFDLEICENDSDLLGLIIDDYWRREVASWQEIFLQYLYGKNINADSIFGKLQGVVQVARKEGINKIDFPPRITPSLFYFPIKQLASLWKQSQEEIIDLLASPALSKAQKEGYHPDNVAEWQKELENYFTTDGENLLPVRALEKLSAGSLIKGTKPSQRGLTPEHDFFTQAEHLTAQLTQAVNGLLYELIEYCLEELPERKNAAGIVSYDDLLLLVRGALRNEDSGSRLAEKIRRQFHALLIDEFQDTDAVQYEIFQTVYGNRTNAMFLIGDPKQAIYRFRGADIYAYLKAVRSAGTEVYGMDTNWRSESGLVHAYNLLFGHTGITEPFQVPEIQYHPVKPAEIQRAAMSVEGHDTSPVSFILFPEQEDKSTAKMVVCRDLAEQINKLLVLGRQGKAYFVVHPPGEAKQAERQMLTAGHMAVLVRSHKDGELVRAALRVQGIRSVMHSRQEVFATTEARELQMVFAGVLRPTDVTCVKSALGTSLLGWQAHDFVDPDAEEALEKTVERFLSCLKLWEERGFAVMAFHLLRQEGVVTRLAGCRNGERRITNVRHIIEILQEESHRERLGPAALFDWFRRQRHAEEKNEERLLRLESDEDLVKIVTIHKSKGLEYPVVFCPFLWDAPYQVKKDKGWVVWHDEDGCERVDMGTDALEEKHLVQVRENMAEEFRLLYVTLTRARNRCFIYWGSVLSRKSSITEKSALGCLLKSFSPSDKFVALPKDSMLKEFPDHLFTPLYLMAACGPESVSVSVSEQYVEDRKVEIESSLELAPLAAQFRTLEPGWAVLSFSALLRAEQEASEALAFDDGAVNHERRSYLDAPSADAKKTMFDFPKGALAGSCLHDIFENLDFTAYSDEQTVNGVKDTLESYGISREWSAPLMAGVDGILRTPLDAGKEGLQMNRIGMEQRLNELEFYFSIPQFFSKELQSIFHGRVDSALLKEKGMFEDGHSSVWYMKGFIDLIFEWQGKYYIIDYKSNHLGNRFEDYQQKNLQDEMIKAGYDMQYHIYLVALNRYLRKRVPGYDYDLHIGGVYYLFIRGMSPEKGPEFGVFKDRPGRQVIDRMEEILVCAGPDGNGRRLL